jgi:hypothetical protein
MLHYDTNAFKHATTRSGYGDPRTVIVDPPSEPRTKSKKDTKKWCKGVVGREHRSVWVYTELLWPHGGGKEIVEGPVPPENQPKFDSRGRKIYYNHPWATLYCTCMPEADQVCGGRI